MPSSSEPKKHLVILGTGFATITLLNKLEPDSYSVTVISPRNHFLFSPLLPSTTVGTIEFRSIIEPIRQNRPGIDYFRAAAIRLDAAKREVLCKDVETGREFSVSYDILVIGVGAVNNTFGTPGVHEYAFFLKEVRDARKIRNKIIDSIERANLPDLHEAERKRLLHFVVVGGGPTGIEFAAEVRDLLEHDLRKMYPKTAPEVRITLFEAGKEILGVFDAALRTYTKKHFENRKIEVRLESPVAEVRENDLVLKSGEVIPAGLVVWSTGYGPSDFIKSLSYGKDRTGRLLVNANLEVTGAPDVFAAGDCCQVEGQNLPQTAQVAMQEGKYLAAVLKRKARGGEIEPFKFTNLGMLAYIGENEALAEIPKAGISASGMTTYLFWRSAYLTRLVSLKNKVTVLFDWTKAWFFGRDLSRF